MVCTAEHKPNYSNRNILNMIKIPTWSISCGGRELILDKTSSPEEILRKIQKYTWNERQFIAGFYFFTETKSKREKITQISKLKRYITKHKLGTIETAEVKKSKITKSYLWTTNIENIKNHIPK